MLTSADETRSVSASCGVLTTSDGGGSSGCCCVPSAGAVFGDRWATLATVLLEPAERTARVLAGSPLQAHDGHWVGLPAGETVSGVAE